MNQQAAPNLEALDAALEPLRRYFNSAADRLRFLALLSPT